MKQNSKIFVAGHRGLVGSAIVRNLKANGHQNLILKTRQELDLLNQSAVNQFFKQEKPEYVFLAAARVGGIFANNTYQSEFLYENLMIACNIIHAAFEQGTEKLLFLGSTCIYPKLAPQPIQESSLLTGPLEPTNEAYAIAKIAGLKLCEKIHKQYKRRFISAMPTNLYGPFDNFHPENAHVIPMIMRRFHEHKVSNAEKVTMWGTGTPKREFLHVDDLADALHMLMLKYEDFQTINVGTGEEVTIAELGKLMKKTVDFKGSIEFDSTKPDGSPRKVADATRIHQLGWKHSHTLEKGLEMTYQWALENKVFK